MLCVLIRIASSTWFLWVHSTDQYCIEERKDFLNYRHLLPGLAPWLTLSGWLELPMSRTSFYGPKAVRAIKAQTYLFCTVLVYLHIQELYSKLEHLLLGNYPFTKDLIFEYYFINLTKINTAYYWNLAITCFLLKNAVGKTSHNMKRKWQIC